MGYRVGDAVEVLLDTWTKGRVTKESQITTQTGKVKGLNWLVKLDKTKETVQIRAWGNIRPVIRRRLLTARSQRLMSSRRGPHPIAARLDRMERESMSGTGQMSFQRRRMLYRERSRQRRHQRRMSYDHYKL